MKKLFLFSSFLIFACSEEDELPVDNDPCSNDSSQIDTDGDGVGNNLDSCQNTPVGQTVNCVGC